MENKQPDYKDSMTQRKTLATGNQTTTQAFVSHGVVYISVSAMTVGRKSKEYILPASDIMYVYPLENYIGYSFNNPYSDLLLKFDNRRTPDKFKKYISSVHNINKSGRAIMLIADNELHRTNIERDCVVAIMEAFEVDNVRVVAMG